MDRELMQYQDRWFFSFENFCSERREPDGTYATYSLRSKKTIHKPNGAKINITEAHRLVWTMLVIRAYDIRESVTTVWLGRERLSQMSGISADLVGKCLGDLEALGWLTKKQRGAMKPNEIKIYLTPQPLGREPKAEPVSIAEADMGLYVTQATRRNLQTSDDTVEPEDFDQIMELLEGQFPGHRSFSTSVLAKFLRTHLLRCVVLSHTVYRCYEVLRLTIDSTAKRAGLQAFEQMRDSYDLGKHIESAFPAWLTLHAHALPVIE